MAFLIVGIVSSGNSLASEDSGTNRTDRTAGSSLPSGTGADASATHKESRAIQMQRERLVALYGQLNELLTKYTEKDKRVRVVRKQIADVEKQLASELPAGGSRTANASNAITRSTNAPAKDSSASSYGANTTARVTDAAANTHIDAPTDLALLRSAATGGGNATAKDTDAKVRTAHATASNNVPVNVVRMEKDEKLSKATPPALVPGDSERNGSHNRKAPSLSSEESNNAPAYSNASVNLITMETLDDKHRLAIGDKLSFRIEEDKYRLAPERETQNERSVDDPTPLLVTDSGELEVPYIGRFPAENKTCKQLAYELKAALEKDYFYKATVILAVDLKAKTLGRVYLTGAVHEPGPEEIPSDEVLTLGKAILRAGGFTDFAERHAVKVTRQAPGSSEPKTLIVDVAQVFDKGKTELDLPLEPGDLILVPERLVRF